SLRSNFQQNSIPYGFYDAQSPAGVRILDELGLSDPELPVVVLSFTREPTALVNPTDVEIADAFGLLQPIPSDTRFELMVIGAGSWPWGTEARATTVLTATGVAYRRHGGTGLGRRPGVVCGAPTSGAMATKGKRVFVVGGGNCAGQAAMHLAKWAERVTILVR